jgi:hypothetical protein
MRNSLRDLKYKIEFHGGDIDEKEIELREILMQLLRLIDRALPIEVEPD